MISRMCVPWPVMIVALTLPTAGALVYFVAAEPDSPAFRVTYAASKVIQFLLPVIALFVFERGVLRRIRPSIRGLGGAFVLGAIMFVAILGAYLGVLRDSPLLSDVAEVVR